MSLGDKYDLAKEIGEKHGIFYNPELFIPIRPKYTDGELDFFQFCYMGRKFDGKYKSFKVFIKDLDKYKKFLKSGELEDCLINKESLFLA